MSQKSKDETDTMEQQKNIPSKRSVFSKYVDIIKEMDKGYRCQISEIRGECHQYLQQ